jgi:hypothetical protein
MKFGYEGIKSIKSGTVRLAENNKTVNKVYLDLVHEFENTANFTFSIDQAEHVANQLLQAVFEHTEKKVVKNKNDITEEEWKIIDEKRWAEIRNKILDFSSYIDLHSFIKTLSVFEILDGSSLYLESNAFGFISIDILLRSCMAIMYADSVDYNDDGDIVEIGERLWSIHIDFKNTKQKEFEYMQ